LREPGEGLQRLIGRRSLREVQFVLNRDQRWPVRPRGLQLFTTGLLAMVDGDRR